MGPMGTVPHLPVAVEVRASDQHLDDRGERAHRPDLLVGLPDKRAGLGGHHHKLAVAGLPPVGRSNQFFPADPVHHRLLRCSPHPGGPGARHALEVLDTYRQHGLRSMVD
jgi:hypothetical protein